MNWLITAALSGAMFFLAMRPIEAFDTFWQLQSGKYIWQTGEFLTRDTFSLAAELFRLEHCWLHDLILYFFFSLGGYTLLSLLKPVVFALCGALLLRWNLQRGGKLGLVFPVLLLCFMGSEPSWLVRPQLWTFLFSLLYLHLLHQGREKGLWCWLWLAPIMLAWANLHAGCVFGIVMIGLFGVGELWRTLRQGQSWRRFGELFLAGIVSFGIAFINPYGWRIPLGQLLDNLKQHKTITGEAPVGMMGNMEWLPPEFSLVPLFYVVMALWALTLILRWRKVDVAEVIFFFALTYMGVSQIRHTTLVALMAGYFLPLAIQELVRRCSGNGQLQRIETGGRLLAVAAVIGLLFFFGGRGALGWGIKQSQYPVEATHFVLEQRPPANMFNAYDWGGYLMWQLYPDYHVFIDGRSVSNKHFVASNTIENAWDGWQQELDKFDVKTIITRTCYYDTGEPMGLISALARSPGWALVYRDDISLVYVRVSPETAELRQRYAMPGRLAYETMWSEASRLLEESATREKAYLSLGRAALNLGQRQKALTSYRHYLEYDPNNREARWAIGFLEQGVVR